MKSLNELLDDSEKRRRYFMRGSSVIKEEPETRPRSVEKRKMVLMLEIAQIKEKVDVSKFSKPPKEMVEGWKSLFEKV